VMLLQCRRRIHLTPMTRYVQYYQHREQLVQNIEHCDGLDCST
jgi:hypothetical protein